LDEMEDRRGLTPLLWSHVLPYGEVKLNNEQQAHPRRKLARCGAGAVDSFLWWPGST